MPILSSEQIEETLEDCAAGLSEVMAVTSAPRVLAIAIKTALRAAWTAGRDHGEATVLERAHELLARPVSDARFEQQGRAVGAILAWQHAVAGRVFTGVTSRADADAYASVFVADSDPPDDIGCRGHYEFAPTPEEALSKLATWCSEYNTAHRPDTMPAPAPGASEPKLKAAEVQS